MEKYNDMFWGFDAGSESVGWAVTNSNYELLRIKGKTAFGSRIFDAAESCKTYGAIRKNKRRISRRKYRLELLESLFADEINKIDNTFFLRLDRATLKAKDKPELNKTLLFIKPGQEKDFYKEYPTIWKLRKDLIDNNPKAFSDLRQVYLAIHHIMKYRGNFIKEGVSFSFDDYDENLFESANQELKNIFSSISEEEYNDIFTKESFKQILSIGIDKNLGTVKKRTQLLQLFDCEHLKSYLTVFSNLAIKGEAKIKDIVDSSKLEGNDTIAFDDSYDEKESTYADLLDNAFVIVKAAKMCYDTISLKKLLNDDKYLCYSMDRVYQNHRKDLSLLKKTLIDIDNKLSLKGANRTYFKIFKDKNSDKNYPAFVNKGTNNSEKRPTINVLNNFILETITPHQELIDSNDFDYLKTKLDNKDFLSIIANHSTSVIPHQLHLQELKMILDNASKHYPFIGKIKDKIISLFLFRVPYYYGPLDDRSKFSNVVRKSNEKINAWNIKSIIDDNATKKNFITKLTKNCLYLSGCKVLPQASIYYQDYIVLDRLNPMQINGNRITPELKEELLNFIFSRSKTSISDIKKYLKNLPEFNSDLAISGVAKEVDFNSSSRFALKELFDLEKDMDLVEDLIFIATIYKDDKSLLKSLLHEEYASLTKPQINAILGLATSKWGSFSKEFLTELRYVDDNGVVYSILDLLFQTNLNLQQILFNEKYNFQALINQYNYEARGEISDKEAIEEILASVPSLFRRTIYQTLAICDDLHKLTKKTPQKIFIEVTRTEDLKKKGNPTNSRYKELKTFITSLKNDVDAVLKDHIDEVEKQLELINASHALKLKSKTVYLYFKQLGFDMYSGNKIDFNEMLFNRAYDIDHVIPQSLIKDDSLDNLVLVNRNANQKIKSDFFPLPPEVKTEKNIALWKYLFKLKCISEKKYNNLMRTTPLTFEEVNQFIARDINALNYSNIALRDILAIKYPKAKLVFSKAKFPSYLRKTLNIAKNRDLNDAHHAVDAYLNIVAGNILTTVFSNPRRLYEEKLHDSNKTLNMESILDHHMKLDNLKDLVIKNCLRHDILVTYKIAYYNKALYKQTIYSPLKKNIISTHTAKDNPLNKIEYGGYSYFKNSFLYLVTYQQKKKTYKKLLPVKYLYEKQFSENELIDLIIKENKLENAENITIIAKIFFNQKLSLNGGIFTLYTRGDDLNLKNAYQTYIDNDDLVYLKTANKYISELDVDIDKKTFFTHRKDEKGVTISKKKNQEIFLRLIKRSFDSHFDTITYMNKIRSLSSNNSFNSLNLKEQVEILNEVIRFFSKKPQYFKLDKTRQKPLDCIYRISGNITPYNIGIIYESPTGLVSKKKMV